VRKYRYVNIVIVTVIAVLIATGAFVLLRPPAPKPLTPQLATPQPIPGVPQFNAAKYRQEPVITVWLADSSAVQSMPLERYLEGVVAREMEPGWPYEALQAQAIASRTLTLNAMEAGTIKKLHNADVSTSKEELQAYAPQKVNDNVRKAVQSTRGQVLLYAGSLINAIYSSSNGQIAATKEESFPKEIPYPTPYFQPVSDNSFKYTPADIQHWTVTIPAAEVASAIGYTGNPADIAILARGPSGRILFIGTGDKKILGADFRKAIGYDRLKSTLISQMAYQNGQFVFTGSGWGNGVGLCQWGAYTYARDGWKAEDILKHYFVGAEIKKIWN